MNNKTWFSFTENGKFEGSEPAFFDISEKSWSKLLSENYLVIKTEFEKFKEENELIPYYNQNLASDFKKWQIQPLYFWGKKNKVIEGFFPKTFHLIEQIDGLLSCSFSVLHPHTHIKPHVGDSNVMYRCHLGLSVPGGIEETGIRVQNEKREWREGSLFAFCDAYEHEAWNNTDEERLVLIVDVVREEFIQKKTQICREVNASIFWQLKFQKASFLSHLPKLVRKILIKLSAPFF
jgi:aspartyl/asparaginyl beta-hydroxylase (cupin superfamily)